MDMPPTGHLVNWKRINVWRELRKKRRAMTPETRRKLLEASPIWSAHSKAGQ